MASFRPMLSHVSWPIKDAHGTEINYLNVHVFVNSQPGTPQHEFAKNIYKVVLGYLSGGKSAPDDFINNSFLSIPAYNENKRLFENIMKRANDFCGRSGMSTSYVSGSSTQNEYITVFITSTNGPIDPIFEKQPLHSVATINIQNDGQTKLYIDSFCGAPKKNNFFDPILSGNWYNSNSGSAKNLGGWRLMKLLLRACQLQGIGKVELKSMPHPDTLKFYENQGFTNEDDPSSIFLQQHSRPVITDVFNNNIKKIIAQMVNGKWEWQIEQAVLKAANAWLKNTGRQIDNLPMSVEELKLIPMPKEEEEDDWFDRAVAEQEKKNAAAAEEEDDEDDWFDRAVAVQQQREMESISDNEYLPTGNKQRSTGHIQRSTGDREKRISRYKIGGSRRKTKRNSKKRRRTQRRK
jgi:hypothetical protein